MVLLRWLKKLFGLARKTTPEALPGAAVSTAATKSTAGAKRAPVASRKKQPKVVIVGIDFGTSSTKMVLGDTTTDLHHLLVRPEGQAEGAAFLFSSVVQIDGEQVFFSSSAVEHRDVDAEFRSFKVCLACQQGLAVCRRCAHGTAQSGIFEYASLTGLIRLEAEHLATWYLAHVIGRAKQELSRRWGTDFDVRPVFNVGAPIDQWNARGGSELFTRVAFYAEKLSAIASNGIHVAELLDAYNAVRAKFLAVPSEEERNVFVQPETAAGLMSLVTSPRTPPGLYGIVDVGAGTTNVSFFRLADFKSDEPRRMSFYEAKTDVIGAGDLDRCLAHLAALRIRDTEGMLIDDNSVELLNAARVAKESLGRTGECVVRLNSWAATLSQRDVQACLAPSIQRMLHTYVETNHQAYKKEPLVSRWAAITVITLGGGTKCQPVYNALKARVPSPYNRQITFSRMAVPGNFDYDSAASDSFDLLAVAYGLSFPPPDFPDILSPGRVAPIDFNLPAKRSLDRDELYAK